MHSCQEGVCVTGEGKEFGQMEGLDAAIHGVYSDLLLARQGSVLENVKSHWTSTDAEKCVTKHCQRALDLCPLARKMHFILS